MTQCPFNLLSDLSFSLHFCYYDYFSVHDTCTAPLNDTHRKMVRRHYHVRETSTHSRGPIGPAYPVRVLKLKWPIRVILYSQMAVRLYLYLKQSLHVSNVYLRYHRGCQLNTADSTSALKENQSRISPCPPQKKYQYHFLCASPLIEEPTFYMLSFLCSLKNIRYGTQGGSLSTK